MKTSDTPSAEIDVSQRKAEFARVRDQVAHDILPETRRLEVADILGNPHGALPEAEDMSVVTGGLDLLVRLRVRDHAHLRELLLAEIFQISGVQRTETFLSLADVEPENFTAALLASISQRRGEAKKT